MPDDLQADNSKQTIRSAIGHLSAATTIFLAGVGAVSKGYVITGLVFMALAVGYLIYELVMSKPIIRNVPGMFRLLIAVFAVSIFVGLNKETIHGFFAYSQVKDEQRALVHAEVYTGNPPKELTGSIQWRPEYTYISITVGNPGPFDFDSLDMAFKFDVALAAVEQVTNFPGVTIFPDIYSFGVSTTQTYIDGTKVTTPAYSRIAAASVYRMRCDHLPRHSAIKLAAAGVAIKGESGEANVMVFTDEQSPGNKLFGPKRLPHILYVTGTYKIGGRAVQFKLHQETQQETGH